jgi:hypothetical protein
LNHDTRPVNGADLPRATRSLRRFWPLDGFAPKAPIEELGISPVVQELKVNRWIIMHGPLDDGGRASTENSDVLDFLRESEILQDCHFG